MTRLRATALLSAALVVFALPIRSADAVETVRPGADVYAFGDARFHGSTGGERLERPVVGLAAQPDGDGYWEATRDGRVFGFGDAPDHGDLAGTDLERPVVDVEATPTGDGYWLVASDGGVFPFGDAVFRGSTGALEPAEPIVGMAATPTGDGYWLVASDGGVFSFGDAVFRGSTGALELAEPVVGMAATPTGDGYWLAARDGGVFTFGDATFHGSAADDAGTKPVAGIETAASVDGYWLVAVNVQLCRNAELVVTFPAQWHTNSTERMPACRYFDPEPFTVTGPAGRYDLALSVFVDPVAFSRASQPDRNARELSRERTTVDGHAAVLIEKVATGEGLLPRGTFIYEYVVDLQGRTLIAATYDVGDSVDEYRRHKAILDDLTGAADIRA